MHVVFDSSPGSIGVDLYINMEDEPTMDLTTEYGWEVMNTLLSHNNTLVLNGTATPVSGSFIFQNDPDSSVNITGSK